MTDNVENAVIAEEIEPPVPVVDEAYSPVPEPQTLGKLVLKRSGAETDIEFPVNPPTTIGRFDPSVGPIDIDLGSLTPEGNYVSRKHARIVLEEGKYILKDLGSSNGTFILRDDFERVDEVELFDGAEVALGNARFVFHVTFCEAQ